MQHRRHVVANILWVQLMQDIQSLLNRGQWIVAALFRYRNSCVGHLLQLLQHNGHLLDRWRFKNSPQRQLLVQLFVNLGCQCRRPQ